MPPRPPRTLLGRLSAAVRAFRTDEEPPSSFLRAVGGGRTSETGIVITDETALRIAAVTSCVRVLAESIATLPLMVFERLPDGDRRAAPDHPVAAVLHDQASPESTAMQVRETALAHVLLRGNSLTRVVRDGAGEVRELWPIAADTWQARRPAPTSPLVFDVSAPGEAPYTLRIDQVWRCSGLSWNGCTGLSPIGLARETFGLAAAFERTSAALMKNGSRLGGIVSYPEKLDEDEFDRRQDNWAELMSGPQNAGRVWMADSGAKFETVGMKLEDLQFIELKRFQVAEIARVFRVPLHMLYDHAAQPRANMEQASLEFVMYSLRPWLVRLEQTYARDLLLPSERARYVVEHNVAGLLRGDFAARMAGYAQGRQWGWLSVNDIRRLENMNAIDDGDIYLQPSNMQPAGTPAAARNP